LKIERRSSEAWEGLKGSPTAERTRFRMTASWTRRFPSMVSSLIRIGGGAGAPGRACASAGETRKASAAKATTNGRPTHPREVTGRQTLAVRRLVLSKLERRVCGRGLRFAEHDDVVDPVQELRPERALHLFHHALFHLVVRLLVGLLEEARRGPLADDAGAEVRRHDQDGVLEVHHVAERVAQAAVVEHLQE